MSISKKAETYHEKMFPNYDSKFKITDPEFIERFDNFAFDEVLSHSKLDDRTRFIVILATLLGCQGIDEFMVMLKASINMGVSANEIKEIVYQSVAYLGIGRVYPFLKAVNEVLESLGYTLPLESMSNTTTLNRLEEGAKAQVNIFGESMKDFYKSGAEEVRHINYWLTDNCFGDYYTRSGLDYKTRELITFCFLASQGGCEKQLLSHSKANIRLGNDKIFLIDVVSNMIPYIGYPRCLNAINCINEASN